MRIRQHRQWILDVVALAEKRQHAPFDGIPAMPIGQFPTQDAPEQRVPFLRRTLPVADERDHRFLHGVEGVFAMPERELGHAEGTAFHLRQESVQAS